ncbi:MAG: 50S ribosomal protein L22 [Acidobacteria bacterium]|nr:50S ribosomal protein L22 [Acidobacteriota bacterium]
MEALAKIRHLKGSPRKARLVIDLIRGRNVSQALAILKFTDKRAADPIAKTLRSAIANATFLAEKQNIAIDPDDLFVKTCFVDMGAHKNRRRMRPAPQGRAFREQRHYCHITIMVSSDLPEAKDDDKSKKKARLAAGKKTDGGDRKSQTSVNPKATKKAAKTNEVKEEKITVIEEVSTVKVKETKKAKAEKPRVEEAFETKKTKVETPIIEESVGADTAKIEEPKAEKTVKVKTTEDEKPTEIKTAKVEKTREDETTDILEVESSKDNKVNKDSKAAKDDAKADAKASDAKNVASQTPAERNETKKADEAQLDDNDILELQ